MAGKKIYQLDANASVEDTQVLPISATASGDAKKETVANLSTKIRGDIVVGDMPTGIDAANIADGSVSNTEFQYISTLSSNVQTQIDGKAASVHTHAVSDITGVTSSAAELNILDGATLTVTELNYVDGVTSSIQTQIDAKLDSSALSDAAYGVGWNGDTTHAPSKNAVYDKIEALSLGAGATELDDLTDVTLTALGVDELLFTQDGTTFINQTLAEAGISAVGHTHTEADITDLRAYLLNVVEDVTPQLGANLDANAFNIGFDDNTGILDDSGNEQLIFQKTASAVNYLEITNSATYIGNVGGPSIAAQGDDTHVNINLVPKGTSGRIWLGTKMNILVNSNSFATPASEDIQFNPGTGVVDILSNVGLADGKGIIERVFEDEIVIFQGQGGSAVNYLDISNAITGNDVIILATGDDADVDLDIQTKGAGILRWDGVQIATLAGGTYTGDIAVPDEAYGAGWNGSLEVPTKNALYDKIETLGGGSGITRTVVVTSGSITLGATASTDYIYFVAGAHTLSMPSPNTNRYTVKNNHSANITIDTAGAENIEGAASISLAPESAVDIASDGTNRFII